MGKRDQAFLLLSHRVSDEIMVQYQNLARVSDRLGEAWLLLQADGRYDVRSLAAARVLTFSFAEIVASGCSPIGPTMSPGNTHFPLLKFFQEHPGFRNYWVIEYDVRYTGDWSNLFETFEALNGDFIACHIRTHAEEPDWVFWPLTHRNNIIPLNQRVRCFHPIYCISNAALSLIHRSHQDSWRGHSEVLLSTLLHHNGFTLIDFGGLGGFVPRGMENKHYIDAQPNKSGLIENGTMRYRPVFPAPGYQNNLLYHPVKTELAWQSVKISM